MLHIFSLVIQDFVSLASVLIFFVQNMILFGEILHCFRRSIVAYWIRLGVRLAKTLTLNVLIFWLHWFELVVRNRILTHSFLYNLILRALLELHLCYASSFSHGGEKIKQKIHELKVDERSSEIYSGRDDFSVVFSWGTVLKFVQGQIYFSWFDFCFFHA